MSQKERFDVSSPDKKIEVSIKIAHKIQYLVKFQGTQILSPSSLSLTLENRVLGTNPQVVEVSRQTADNIIRPVVREKNAVIDDRYNELIFRFRDHYGVAFRVYDDGVAYRFITDMDVDNTRIMSEQVELNFSGNYKMYFSEEDTFMTQYERSYKYLSLGDIRNTQFCSLPALVETDEGPKVLITEADLKDYPGLYLQGSESPLLTGIFPHVATEGEMKTEEDYQITERAPYIAETQGTRTFPWRVLIIAEKDESLVENQMVYKLATQLQLEDTSWIKPGKATWNWWNNENIYGVDFRAGVNMQTYKYYIDFASQLDLEYFVIDETWYETRNLLSIDPDLNIQELVDYGREKNVGIILWAAWKDLDDQWEAAFEQFSKWGISGIKLDFMKRDDQWMVNWYWKVAKEAAGRKLLVDFHGAYKPAGLRRTYPNVITREAVKGLEQVKGLEEHFHPDWSDDITSGHNLTLPFIRMVAGPMDYTPGAMTNAQPESFRAIGNRPMSRGTRCHQLAMYIVFESPLQMLADSPSRYLEQNDDLLKFLSEVPVTWDATHVLSAKTGHYILIARRKKDQWYVGAMTNENDRKLKLDFTFLEAHTYTAEIYSDGINADRYAEDYRYSTREVTPDSTLEIQLAPGGGWVGIFTPVFCNSFA